MDYVRLGASGLQVSRLCLGCMSYGQATTGYSHPWASSEHDGRTHISLIRYRLSSPDAVP